MLTIAKANQIPKTWPALPYKGLSYYEPADAPLFAGREQDVIECADLLARSETRILILHGSTGCGKSSFLRAGLIPFLEHDDLGFGFLKNDADGKLTSIFVRATGKPLVELARKVWDLIKSDIKLKKAGNEEYYSLNLPEIVHKYESETEFIEKVSTDPDLFIKILGKIAVRLPKTLVLIIDQGEEVITLKPNLEDDLPMRRFFRFIELFSDTCYDLKLLIALRTEFYGRFRGKMSQSQTPTIAHYLLGDLIKDQIVSAIERPTSTEYLGDFGTPFEHYRFKYEEGLPEKIATDLLSKKLAGGILPVMQIVCETLYQNISSNSGEFLSIEAQVREISEASYRSLGSIEDQIDTSLNATFEHWCQQNDITSEADIEREIERWKDVLSNLAGSQPDGTVTTDVATAETLKYWTIEKKCKLDFEKTIKHLVSPSVRILRDVEFFDTRSKSVVRYSLGHDAIGLALYRWKVTRLTNLTNLDLSGNQLTSLPAEIVQLTNLISLNLSFNRLTSLPAEIMLLTNLTNLSLSGNQLTSLPAEITRLTNLTSLSLSGNKLTSLSEITRLTNLTSLDLSGNQLTSLPAEIVQLMNLTDLSLSDNKLTSLSAEITRLTNLTSLSLSGNKLTSLSEITRLTNLTSLDLSGNQLTSLPAGIAQLPNLTSLSLSGNKLTSLPAEIMRLTNLTSLSLSGNKLTSLPAEIMRLTKLTYLDLQANHLPIFPEALSNPQDVKAIFAALAGLQTGERLNEAKLLVVGDGMVGKSSVVERLIYDTFNPNEKTTLGVEINDEMQILQSEVKGKDEPIKLNIWDFGGQEIQHSTHQFFLTTRSLYLLVIDARKADQLSSIEYWLKLIESFAGDSPIIIVINQIDQLKGQRPLNLNRKALQAKHNIRDFVETSCATGEGIAMLRAAIAREAEALKHVHDIWPREWLAIKKRLKEMRADYIPVEIYLEICAEENLNDDHLRHSLLDMLHVLGIVIRFPGDTQVLNPRWVTQGVYALLTSPELVKAQGQFDLKDVGEILARLPDATHHYPSHTHRRLIDVMKHFELCFEFIDRPGHYLIPRHLHDNELDIPWDDVDALKFQYHYEVLPDAVISRFITRMNQYITKQYYWKNGVFLHTGENRAKIKADLVDQRIFIAINGKEQTRRAFLAVIRSAFDEINSNFKIEIKQMIPVPGYPEVLVSYNDLMAHEEMNEPEILISELRKEFSVRELLDGIEDSNVRFARRFQEKKFSSYLPEDLSPEPAPPGLARPNSSTGLFMSYMLAFVVLLGAILAMPVVLSKYVSVTAGVMTGVVIIGALLAIGVIGAMQLRNDDRLSEESFLKLIIESYKRLPLLRGER